MFNHLSAVSESVPALGWVAVVSRELQNWAFKKRFCHFAQDQEQILVVWTSVFPHFLNSAFLQPKKLCKVMILFNSPSL